ncbi:ABC transporter substrate-binding protein [Rothia nasisuis]|uniref:ABC transporter substrate-binding protein n=1 Tax=Rothia nasisuis TaxID=2109647 RepID=UPI001F4046E2|nr:ABC transporter substrate-binding protein [Rothia nasisuis]
MNITRRSALSLAGLAAATAALSACAGTGSGTASAQQEGNGTLQFWSNHPGSSRDIEQQLIDAWNAANPDTPAELIDGGKNYEELGQKFNAALSGGELPDVIVASDVTWFNFAFTGATTPLNDLWEPEGIDTSTYVETLLADYTYDGKNYGVPYSRSTPLMYWYTADLEKAGLPTDGTGPATWQEFAETWAPKLKEATGKPALTVADGSNYLDWYFQGAFWTFGGAYSTEWDLKFTDPKTIEAGTFLQTMVKDGLISVVKDSANEFGIGNACGLLESTGSLGGLKESATGDFITTYLPGPKPGTTTGGAGLAIPAGISEERKKIAVKFIDFITNTENTITFTQATGYMPVRTDAADVPEQAAYMDENPNAATAIRQLNENTKSQDYARVFINGGGQAIGGALDKIVAGQDVETVFTALQEELQATYDRDIKPNL